MIKLLEQIIEEETVHLETIQILVFQICYQEEIANILPDNDIQNESLEEVAEKENGLVKQEFKEEFALKIENVVEISKMLPISLLPLASNNIEGVINLRGQILPIFSIIKKLGFESDSTKMNQIVIVKEQDKLMGFLLQNKPEILRISVDKIENTPEINNSNEVRKAYIQNVIKINERIISLLDLKKILQN
ncbi:MAG: chemotaxis protein CheW [Candidatus Margulisiibacteriota bacterium]|jgi:purine-binding chemotaxis protein CheW